jgi:hypothetical protein
MLYDPVWDKLASAGERAAGLDRIAEPMLELSDPLWNKLDDANCDRNIPTLLVELAASWDREAANSLLWDCLCHQENCHGATYAAIPHLLKIAEPEENRRQRLGIADFLGFVALCAREGRSGQCEVAVLQGLPETLEEWDRFRGLVTTLERSDRLRSRYEAVNADDLKKILSIKAGFFRLCPPSERFASVRYSSTWKTRKSFRISPF